jgi:hypothetical protein
MVFPRFVGAALNPGNDWAAQVINSLFPITGNPDIRRCGEGSGVARGATVAFAGEPVSGRPMELGAMQPSAMLPWGIEYR